MHRLRNLHLHFLIGIFVVSSTMICQAQLYSVEPGTIDGRNVVMEYDHATIRDQGIAQVSNYYCMNRNDELQFIVAFDTTGRPIELFEGAALVKRAKQTANQRNLFGRKWMGCRWVQVDYDTDGRLFHLNEQSWDDEFSRSETIVSITYDDSARQFTQQEEFRTLYREGYKYKGHSFADDTTMTRISRPYEDVLKEAQITVDTTITVARSSGSARTLDGCIPLYRGDSTLFEWKGGALVRTCHIAKGGNVIFTSLFKYRSDGLIEAEYDEKSILRERWEYSLREGKER